MNNFWEEEEVVAEEKQMQNSQEEKNEKDGGEKEKNNEKSYTSLVKPFLRVNFLHQEKKKNKGNQLPVFAFLEGEGVGLESGRRGEKEKNLKGKQREKDQEEVYQIWYMYEK